VKNIESLLFRMKWLMMSPEARYSCLWNRTRVRIQVENAVSLRR